MESIAIWPTPSAFGTSPKNDDEILYMVYGLGRWYTGVRGDGIHVDLLRIISQKIDLSNPLVEEEHIKDAIFVGRSQGY